MPPALRIDSKMESVSAKVLKLIRPSRYIDTVKFKRKAWARKIVHSNPFLYGSYTANEQRIGQISPPTSFSSPDVAEEQNLPCSSPGNESMNGSRYLYETSTETKVTLTDELHHAKEEHFGQQHKSSHETIQNPSNYPQCIIHAIPHQPHQDISQLPPAYGKTEHQRESSYSSVGQLPQSSPEIGYNDQEEDSYVSPGLNHDNTEHMVCDLSGKMCSDQQRAIYISPVNLNHNPEYHETMQVTGEIDRPYSRAPDSTQANSADGMSFAG